MNKVELVSKVAETAGLTKVQAEAAVNAFITVVGDTLKKGDKVSLKGFGSFELSERKERVGKVPGSDQIVTIPARKAPVFKASSTLKKSVNE
ncbi:MAG: HU family DNA-binding protein [Bacilli bacterium]|nr:HU family DNA-binding protein [Bacilli bacterium]